MLTYLNTMGAGTQNLTKILLILLCKVFSSRNHDVYSYAEAPAVGSGAPQVALIWLGWAESSSSSILWAVGKTCRGNSDIKYCANFWSWSLRNLCSDSETGARRQTCFGWKIISTYNLIFYYYSINYLSINRLKHIFTETTKGKY